MGIEVQMQKNRIEIAGMLASKPETRLLPSGTRVANVRLAEDYVHRDKDGKLISHTNWYNLAFYDQMSEAAATYEKGDNIYVEGRIEQRKFTPKDGSERNVQEVVVKSCHLIGPPRDRKSNIEITNDRAIEDESWPIAAT
jgi:single-strand DNA-binding protein